MPAGCSNLYACNSDQLVVLLQASSSYLILLLLDAQLVAMQADITGVTLTKKR